MLLEGEKVAVRCVHWDTVSYPLAEVQMQLTGVEITLKASVSEKVPIPIVLRTAMLCLGELLQQMLWAPHTQEVVGHCW